MQVSESEKQRIKSFLFVSFSTSISFVPPFHLNGTVDLPPLTQTRLLLPTPALLFIFSPAFSRSQPFQPRHPPANQELPHRPPRLPLLLHLGLLLLQPCLSFAGVVCSQSSSPSPFVKISSTTLGTGLADSPSLSGTLPPAITALSALQQLVVQPGAISGHIPPNLDSLSQLLFLSITKNLLSRPIPDSISTLPNLHTLYLNYNRLTGSLLPSLVTLPDLKVLILAANCLSGQLPEVWSQLIHLDLKKNAFSHTLPPLPLLA